MIDLTIITLLIIVIIAIAIVVIIFRVTNPNSKSFKMSCKYSQIICLDIELKTTEKSTPSDKC